ARDVQREAQPARGLRVIAPDRPEEAERGTQSCRRRSVARVASEVERREQIVPFGGECADPWQLARSSKGWFRGLSQAQEVSGSRGPPLGDLPGLCQPLQAVLPDRFQHAVAGLGSLDDLEQRLVNEGSERVHDGGSGSAKIAGGVG